MSNLDVALRLRLVNQLSGPANKAEKDLRDIDQAARRLNGARGGQRLAGDLAKVSTEANRADAAMRKLDQSAKRLRDTRGRFTGGMGAGSAGAGIAQEVGSGLGLPPVALDMAGLGARGGAIAAGVLAATAALTGAVKAAMAFEDAMAEVRKAVDMPEAEFASLQQTIQRISRDTPLAAEEIAKLVAQAGFAGRPMQDLARFGTFAAKAAVAFGLSAEESGDRLAKLGNVFQLNQEQIEALADAVNYLGDNMAAKEVDIMEFLGRVGGKARIFGLSEAQTAAFGSAILSLGVSSEVASTGFDAMLTKLQTASKQGKDFQGGLKALGLSSKQLSKMIAEGPAEAIVEVFRRIKELKPEKQMGVLTDLMGLEYADDAARMAQSLDLIIKSLDMIDDPARSKGSVERAFSIFDDLTSSKIKKMNNQFSALGVNIGKSLTPAIGGAAEAVSSLLEKINAVFDRAVKIDEMIAKRAKGEALPPDQQAELDKNPGMRREVEEGQRREHHDLFQAKKRVEALEQKRATALSQMKLGVEGSREWLEDIEARLTEARAEMEKLLAVPGAKDAMATSMQGVTEAIGTEGAKAVEKAQSIADWIRGLFNFTATPTISPKFAPGGASLPDGSPVPLPPAKPKSTSSISSSRSFAQANTFNIYGATDPQRSARAVDRRLARLGSGASALNDTVG